MPKKTKTLSEAHKATIGAAMRKMYAEKPQVRKAKSDHMKGGSCRRAARDEVQETRQVTGRLW
jgi:hypothetical protein